jgi:hypothetical protein
VRLAHKSRRTVELGTKRGQKLRDGGGFVNLDSSGERGEAQVAEELTGLLGHAPAEWSAETLTHNVYSAVTAGIWRIRAGSAPVVVLKVISSAGTAASEEWSSSE